MHETLNPHPALSAGPDLSRTRDSSGRDARLACVPPLSRPDTMPAVVASKGPSSTSVLTASAKSATLSTTVPAS